MHVILCFKIDFEFAILFFLWQPLDNSNITINLTISADSAAKIL